MHKAAGRRPTQQMHLNHGAAEEGGIRVITLSLQLFLSAFILTLTSSFTTVRICNPAGNRSEQEANQGQNVGLVGSSRRPQTLWVCLFGFTGHTQTLKAAQTVMKQLKIHQEITQSFS